jgi:two-component sensor histidine kinase
LFSTYGVDTNKITLNTNIETIHLGIGTAIPCGLIINELVSNSIKHAFPKDRKGEIKISLHTNGEDKLELIVSDNGSGLPKKVDLSNIESMGLHLVKILTKQLNGDIKLDRTKGTEFQIQFNRGP